MGKKIGWRDAILTPKGQDLFGWLNVAREELRAKIESALQATFPIGSTIYWQRGRSGVIQGKVVDARAEAHSVLPAIWAENSETGKVTKLSLSDVR